MNITIRQAVPEDSEALLGLLKALFEIESDFSFNADKQRKGLALMLAGGEGRCVLAAEEAGAVIGMVTAQTLISTAEGHPVGLIEDLVVRNGHRGKGIGQKLLAGIEAWAVQQGLARLQLLADRDNQPALRFYEKNGWSKTKLVDLRKIVVRH